MAAVALALVSMSGVVEAGIRRDTNSNARAARPNRARPGRIRQRRVARSTHYARLEFRLSGRRADQQLHVADGHCFHLHHHDRLSIATRVMLDAGTESDSGVRAFQISLVLTPAGSPPPPSLASLILSPSVVPAGSRATGTVLLTTPAPAGGAVVSLQGSMEGTVITPPSATVPADSLNATFTTAPAPQVNAPHWVFIGARYGTSKCGGACGPGILREIPALGRPGDGSK